MFASKEVEEEAKKEVAKAPAPIEVQNDAADEQQSAKVVGPTPEQILAIKVLSFVRPMFLLLDVNFLEMSITSYTMFNRP